MAKKKVLDLYLSDEIEMDGSGGGIPLSGGTVSGSLRIEGGDLNVVSGNYVQTNSTSGVYNFSGKNAYLQAESSKYGIACTGSKGYCILNANPTTKKVKLSGDISEIISKLENGTLSNYWSYSIWNNSGTSCFQIIDAEQTETSAGVITVNPCPNSLNTGTKTEEECIEYYYDDDNGIYYPTDPTVGNCLIINAYGNHAEGQSTKALGRQTHAEGRGSIADIRYSHAEGTFTYAGGMASHAEGYGAAGDTKHKTIAMGTGSHAEGWMTKTFGNGSHAEGCTNISYMDGSHVEGGNADHSQQNIAFGRYSHAEGNGECYAGSRYFQVVSCDNDKNTITLQTVEGLYKKCNIAGLPLTLPSIVNWKILDVDSETNTISVNYIPEGIKTGSQVYVPENPKLGDEIDFSNINQAHIRGDGAHAEGKASKAIGYGSHAEGYRNLAIGDYSHANGAFNKTGIRAYASGRGNGAYAEGSTAIGYSNTDSYDSNTLNFARKSFAWSGNGQYVISEDKEGTFNINPVGGVNGFYIGENKLGFGGKEFDLTTGEGMMEAIVALIEKLGGKTKTK